jgi:hypothetical protein
MFKLNGVVKVINPTVQVTEKFSKREFVLTDNSSMYPQDILFQIVKDKVDILDAFGVGQQVEVSFNTKGRVWVSPQGEEKYFNTLECWKIESVGQPVQAVAQPMTMASSPITATADNDDLPF